MRAGLTSLPALLNPLVRDLIICRAIMRVPGNTVDNSRGVAEIRGVGEWLMGEWSWIAGGREWGYALIWKRGGRQGVRRQGRRRAIELDLPRCFV